MKQYSLKINTQGVNEFIKLCQCKKVTENDIKNLLSLYPYHQTIKVMRYNFNIPTYDNWLQYFSTAFQCEGSEKYNLDSVRQSYSNYLKKIISDPKKLKHQVNEVTNILKSQRFVEIASKYLPDNSINNEIEILLLVFAPNAGGNESLFIDVPFLGNLSHDNASRILAHELHHVCRSNYSKNYATLYNNYPEIHQSLLWLEAEGLADLCNFQDTFYLYENYFNAPKNSMTKIIQGMDKEIEQLSSLILDDIGNNIPNDTIIIHLRENWRFHSIGWFMANMILTVLGSSEVKSVVGDMVKFINVYQKACLLSEENKKFAYSPVAIDLINKITNYK